MSDQFTLGARLSVAIFDFEKAKSEHEAALAGWGDYRHEMDLLVHERVVRLEKWGPESDKEWDTIIAESGNDSNKITTGLKALQEKTDRLESEIDEKFRLKRRSYVTTMLPFYKRLQQAHSTLFTILPELVELVGDHEKLNIPRYSENRRPVWYDSVLETAIIHEEKGVLEQELNEPYFGKAK